ncbi:MAG: phosphatase PAP2 family protein [Acidobacteriaceae bacterium]
MNRLPALTLLIAAGLTAGAQSELPNAPAPQPQPAVTVLDSPGRILHDQAAIWTSPTRIRAHDLVWLAPVAAAEAAALATDHRAMSTVVSTNPTFNHDNVDVSNVLIGGLIALPVGIFSYGHLEQDDHARTAGILSAEALLDGVAVEQGMKLIFWRERPGVDQSRGRFFQSSAGIDSSFPSSHTVLAWATASELAGEYPSPWAQAGLYSMAGAVSLTRVLGRSHFPGDVLAGSVAGWLVGRYVFRAHHRHHLDAR